MIIIVIPDTAVKDCGFSCGSLLLSLPLMKELRDLAVWQFAAIILLLELN